MAIMEDSMCFDNIPRVGLSDFPTPLEPLDNLSRQLGGRNQIYMKRDDLMGLGTGGNKLRSLEFWLADGISKGADLFLVAGLPQSNLCRLTAAACCRLGLECHIIHNAEDGCDLTGNQLLNNIMGVKRIFCGQVDEYRRGDFVLEYAQKMKAGGRTPYIVGDQTLGAMGYVAAAKELAEQLEQAEGNIRHIFISASAGPTETGLLFGLCLLNCRYRLHMVSVEYEQGQFWQIADDIFEKLAVKLKVKPALDPRDVGIFYGNYLGGGYARPTPGCINAVRRLASAEGIFMETTYNAKVLEAMLDMVEKQQIPPGEGVCLINTGGTAALFAQGEYFVRP